MPAIETLIDLHVLPGEVMSYTSTGQNNAYIGLQAPTSGAMTASGPYASLTNDGEIRFTSSGHLASYLIVHSQVIGGGNTILNRGQMHINALEGSAGLIHMGNGRATVRNEGLMEVRAAQDAHILREMFLWDVVNTGVMRVTSGGYAFGLIAQFQIELTNTNTIWVTSTGASAWGVSMGNGDGSWVINSGMISGRAIGPVGVGVGVSMGSAYTDALLQNSGTIQGSHASVTGGGEATGGRHIIRNSGTLNGEVLLGASRADILNTGTINGDVFLGGSDDLFAGAGGTLNGAIFGEGGDDAITTGLDDDWLDGGEGNDRLDGGGGDNVMRGANGEDVFISGAGADQIDGGADFDVVDFSSLNAGVTVDLRLGEAQAAGAGGTDALVSIEGVRGTNFADTLVAASRAVENAGRLNKLETTVNQSIGTAISLDGLFASREDLDFKDSLTTPHVVVTAANSGGREYYRFTVTEAGEWGRFDIDHVDFSWNLNLTLYDALGNEIFMNNDWEQDPGSNSPADPYFDYRFAEPGVYYLSVDQQTTYPLNLGVKYTLTVGLTHAPVTGDAVVGSTLWGGAGDDTLIGSKADDVFEGGAGDDVIQGGGGWDILLLSGSRGDYKVLRSGDDFIVNGPDGLDRISGVAMLRFSDGSALDLARQVLLSPGDKAADDAFVLPGLPHDQPPVLPDIGADKCAGDALVLPGADDPAVRLFAGLEARLDLMGDRMLTLGPDGGLIDKPAVRDGDFLF